MSASDEPRKDDNSKEIAEVKAVAGGVETAVNSQWRMLVVGRADGPKRVAGERFKEAPLFKDFNHIGIGIGIRPRRPEKLLGSRKWWCCRRGK